MEDHRVQRPSAAERRGRRVEVVGRALWGKALGRLLVELGGEWPNGWQNWTIISPGPFRSASFTVKPHQDLGKQAQRTARRFLQAG